MMSNSRRNFLKLSALAFGGMALKSASGTAKQRKEEEILGIQLYSVREDMKKDPVNTLRTLAEMGYRYVEHANYEDRKFYGYSPLDFKRLLSGFGLEMPTGHVAFGLKDWDAQGVDFTDEWKYTIEDALVVGQKYLINPWMEESVRNDYNKLMHLLELFNKTGELCKQFNLSYGYHNHDFEFSTTVKNKRLFDLILDETDPELVAQQLDIGNMFDGGGDVIDVIKANPGRFKLLHVKDEIKSDHGELGGEHESTVLGEGLMPVKSIMRLAKGIGGTSYFIIEQESYQKLTPLETAQRNYAVMRNWGF